jgi:hypothetical protein
VRPVPPAFRPAEFEEVLIGLGGVEPAEQIAWPAADTA